MLMVLAGEIILCVAHGTSLRGIVKHLENLTPQEICGRDLPNGIPIVYRSDKHFVHVIYIKFDQGLMEILKQKVLLCSLLIQRGSKKLWQESTILDKRSDISTFNILLFYYQM